MEQNLKILNGLFNHKDIYEFPWTEPTRKLKSSIDFIVVKQTTQIKWNDVRVYPGGLCRSDHQLVIGKAIFYPRCFGNANLATSLDSIHQKPQYNMDSLKEECTKFLYKLGLANKIQRKTEENTLKRYYFLKKYTRSCMESLWRKTEVKRKEK